LRYVELNPVRAGLVTAANCWWWSSAAAHCGMAPAEPLLAMEFWNDRWSDETWREYLLVRETSSSLQAIRRNTHSGRPLGSAEFTRTLELQMKRPLAPRKRGPKPQASNAEAQACLAVKI
jgi:putative transposase